MDSLETQLLKAVERNCKHCSVSIHCPFKEIRNKKSRDEKLEWIKSVDKEEAISLIGHNRMCIVYDYIKNNFKRK